MKNLLLLLTVLIFTPFSFAHAEDGDDHDHDHAHEHTHKHEEMPNSQSMEKHEKEENIRLTSESIKKAGILIETLRWKNLEDEITSPGEVILNSYLSSKVTPRVTAQIVSRHAKLGEKVEKGQSLVTLSSVAVAEAVGDAIVAYKEWQRVRQLGPSAVSAKRYNEAKIANDQATAKAIAYGITKKQLSLHKKGKGGNPGEFNLVAPQKGTIVSDNFIEGELIEPGRILFDIANEEVLWVESRLSPDIAKKIELGSDARIRLPEEGWLYGKVIQKHHLLDQTTRTIGVRIEVENKEDRLHPGMYVDTKIKLGGGKQHLAVPTSSLLRSSDGDWIVFIENKNGEFNAQEIEVVRNVDKYTIIRGLPEGTRIVTKGAFFLYSELAKSGFSVHNH